jgi:hypothetical protein
MRIARWGLTAAFSFAVSFATLGVAQLTAAAAEKDAELFEVKSSDSKATVGVKGTTSLTIAGKNGWHVNEEAPVSLTLTPETGIAVDKAKLTKADLAEHSKEMARFDVAFTASKPGRQIINAQASFVICQATACKPIRQTLALAVQVDPTAKKLQAGGAPSAPSPGRARPTRRP